MYDYCIKMNYKQIIFASVRFLGACNFCRVTNNCLHNHILFYHTCFTSCDGLMAVHTRTPVFTYVPYIWELLNYF
jgi:hypothetical protein